MKDESEALSFVVWRNLFSDCSICLFGVWALHAKDSESAAEHLLKGNMKSELGYAVRSSTYHIVEVTSQCDASITRTQTVAELAPRQRRWHY